MSIINGISNSKELTFEESVMRYFINSLKFRPMKRFDSKQASIVDWHVPSGFHILDPHTGEIIEFNVTALKSYDTMVACLISVLFEGDNIPHFYFIEWKGYSRTTSKQVTQWKNKILPHITGVINYVTFKV